MRRFALYLLYLAALLLAATPAFTQQGSTGSTPGPAAVQDPCEPLYETAIAAITANATGQGIQQKLTTKVVNAWRMYLFDDPHDGLQQVDTALKLLKGPSTKQMSADARAQLTRAITAFGSCLAGAPPPPLATLTVRTFLLDDTAPNQMGPAAGAGVYVRVDGVTVGQTGADGTLTAEVPSGALTVQAVVPSFSEGDASITLAPGGTGEVTIVLDDGKEVVESNALSLVEMTEGILPSSFASFTLQFDLDGAVVPLVRIEEIALLDRAGNVASELGPLFALSPAGTMVATDVATLRSTLLSQYTNTIAIRAQGVDAAGFTYENTVQFHLGLFQLLGTLTPPPSNPGLSVSNIDVTVALLGTDVLVTRTSDSSGHFAIASMPIGDIGFDSSTLQGGSYYYGQGTMFLGSSTAVSLVMRNVADVLNGVPPLTQGPIPAAAAPGAVAQAGPPPEETQARRAADQAALAGPAPFITPADTTASIMVTAGQQNVPVTQSATLVVPQGTKTVTLTYSVFTFEFPYYVGLQSIYNDLWAVSVYGGTAGQQLFAIARNVNSQLYLPPLWQSDGSTGQISEVLNVEALTASADATLTLGGSATNIGDSQLPTIVTAQLSTNVKLTIDTIVPDTVVPTTGDSSYYSIPRPSEGNVFERWFTLGITKPDTATVTSVRVILRGADNLQILFDEAPGANVQVVDASHIRVRVTMQTLTSTVSSTPPPTSEITYRFRVMVDDSGQTLLDERDSGPRNPLWRMPDGFARYGVRDVGLDDWAAYGAYLWLQTNAALITRIDDVSGEHARNIGHATHQRGVDIDEFHYYTFPGAVSGGGNYTALRGDVIAALQNNAPAAARVASWVTASRNGLDALLALDTVNMLYYSIGDAYQAQVTPQQTIKLGAGWASTLLRTGKVTAVTGEVLDTGLGTWTNANSTRIHYNSIHNTHIHIGLDSTLLE